MAKIRYYLKNLSLLNILLAVAAAYLITVVAFPFYFKKAAFESPAAKAGKEEGLAKAKGSEAKGPSPMDYAVIAEQNPFHPERKIPVPKVEAPPLPKPDFVLYGTLETDELSVAYMEDKKAPKTTQGRGKRVTTVRLGDSLSGFVLKEVSPDRVSLARGDEHMVVYLSDKGKVRDAGGGTAAGTAPAAAAHAAPHAPHSAAATAPPTPHTAQPPAATTPQARRTTVPRRGVTPQ